jgi:ubiquitin-conjugating enzyme E2 J2
MLTPSGRFEVNKKICMSYSDFHPELWNPLWGVATIVIGTISFMMTEDITYGGIR